MRIVIDTDDPVEAFQQVSRHYLRLGYELLHWTTYSWMGRQLVQLPDDVLRLAEAVWRVQPDVILETGAYEGGSSLLFATLCRMMGKGRVISVEIDPRPGVREVLSANGVELVGGDSAAPATAQRVKQRIGPEERVFVFLDSDHSQTHVLAELEHYAPLVAAGSFVVVADTNIEGPRSAVAEFLAVHPEFRRASLKPKFHAATGFGHISYFEDGWIERIE